jgi:hypothetical protein
MAAGSSRHDIIDYRNARSLLDPSGSNAVLRNQLRGPADRHRQFECSRRSGQLGWSFGHDGKLVPTQGDWLPWPLPT